MNRRELEVIVRDANSRFATPLNRYLRVIQRLDKAKATYGRWETNGQAGLSVKTSHPVDWVTLKLDGQIIITH